MAQLKIFLNGKHLSTQDLSAKSEWMIGRGDQCDIVLQPEPGISRQHLLLRKKGSLWMVESLSRFGELYSEGSKESQLVLRDGASFSVPPYEFVFEGESQTQTHSKAQTVTGSRAGDGETQIGVVQYTAYLKLKNGDHVQNYRLEGNAWVGGRNLSCAIFIDNPHISREQFEIQKQDEVFSIRNLSAVNETMVNGRSIPADSWTQLSSGDTITVGNWDLKFELRDPQFEEKLKEVDPALLVPVNLRRKESFSEDEVDQDLGTAPAQDFGTFTSAPPPPPRAPRPKAQPPGMKLFGKHIPGLNPVRLAIVVIIVFSVLYTLVQNQETAQEGPPKVLSPFEKLTPDKQQIVKQHYASAQSLFAQGRYQLTLQEITHLHQLIPFYEDSKQIEEAANRGLAIEQERIRAEQEAREKELREQQIMHQVAECRTQLNKFEDMPALDTCLSGAIAADPQHPAILGLRQELDVKIAEKALAEQKKKEYWAKVQQLRVLFEKAEKIEKQDDLIQAIEAYRKVKDSSLPDPYEWKSKAKRKVASLEDIKVQRQERAESEAEKEFREGRLKQAILVLREGMKIDPDNEVLKGRHLKYMTELRKAMMGYYQEGILEESMGEVETAKSKWKKIIDLSLPGEDYFEKARIKLKKYGAI